MKLLKDNIKALRKRDNLTQGDLARKLHIKQYTVSDYEIGRIEPSIAVLTRMADVFHVSTDYLLGRKTKENPFDEDAEKNDEYVDKIADAVKPLEDSDKQIIVDLVNFSIETIIKDKNKSI